MLKLKNFKVKSKIKRNILLLLIIRHIDFKTAEIFFIWDTGKHVFDTNNYIDNTSLNSTTTKRYKKFFKINFIGNYGLYIIKYDIFLK